MDQPLWRLLLQASNQQCDTVSLTCEDCFEIFVQLAEMTEDELPPAEALEIIKAHLTCCPDCWADFAQRLAALEQGTS